MLGELDGVVLSGDDRPDIHRRFGARVEVVPVPCERPREVVVATRPFGLEPLGAEVVLGGVIAEPDDCSAGNLDEVMRLDAASAAEIAHRVVAGASDPCVRPARRQVASVVGPSGTRTTGEDHVVGIEVELVGRNGDRGTSIGIADHRHVDVVAAHGAEPGDVSGEDGGAARGMPHRDDVDEVASLADPVADIVDRVVVAAVGDGDARGVVAVPRHHRDVAAVCVLAAVNTTSGTVVAILDASVPIPGTATATCSAVSRSPRATATRPSPP